MTDRVLNVLIVPRAAGSSSGLDHADGSPQTLLVDRQPLFLAALATLLSAAPVNANVRTLTRSDAALEMLHQFAADLVLCEARAVPLSGPDLASTLSERSPSTKVVLLADEDETETLLSAIHSGATGFFTKDCPPNEFIEGIQAVLAGHFVVERSLVDPALTAVVGKGLTDIERSPSSLSASERGILAMVGQAQSIASIALERGISQKTVRNQLSNAYRKLGIRNRTEAILWAVRLGLVDADVAGRD